MATQSLPSTSGELDFKDYLNSMNYPYEFEKEFPGKRQRPDYTVTKNREFLFDVKDFDPYMPLGAAQYDPYPRIREKIDEGRRKFRQFKEFPCSIVLKNNGNVFVHLDSTDIMLGSMYGDAGFSFPIDIGLGRGTDNLERKFLSRGKMVRHAHVQNTTISALITLRYVAVGMQRYRKMVKQYPKLGVDETLAAAAEHFPNFDLDEKHLGVIVWENAFARIPLSRDLFKGQYDQRWGCEDGRQLIVFTGEELAALEIKGEENPEI